MLDSGHQRQDAAPCVPAAGHRREDTVPDGRRVIIVRQCNAADGGIHGDRVRARAQPRRDQAARDVGRGHAGLRRGDARHKHRRALGTYS
jgi:hypothetical protein